MRKTRYLSFRKSDLAIPKDDYKNFAQFRNCGGMIKLRYDRRYVILISKLHVNYN